MRKKGKSPAARHRLARNLAKTPLFTAVAARNRVNQSFLSKRPLRACRTGASADATLREGLAVELAFASHLIGRIGRCGGIERFPTRLTIGRPALLDVYGSAIKNRLAF